MSKIKSIKQEKKYIRVPLDDSIEIFPHPEQEEIYVTQPDEEFINSIRDHGIRQEPKVCLATDVFDKGADKEDICIISGHRRFAAAQILGYDYVDCELESYDNKLDTDIDHLILNNQRKKTHKEKAAEVKAIKQKLYQARKLYNDHGVKAVENFKSLDIGHYVREGKLDEFFNRDTFKIIEEKTGVSEKHQRQYNTIFNDEWLQDKISEISVNDRLSDKKKSKAVRVFSELVHEAREAVDKDSEISINKAYNEINKVWKQIEEAMNPKEKKEKKKKIRKPKQKPFFSQIDLEKDDGSYSQFLDPGFSDDDIHITFPENEPVLFDKKNKEAYKIDVNLLIEFIKSQK